MKQHKPLWKRAENVRIKITCWLLRRLVRSSCEASCAIIEVTGTLHDKDLREMTQYLHEIRRSREPR